jgi:hypothetical protein
MRSAIAASTLCLIVVGGAQATAVRGTLSGVVMRGPIAPVCVAEQPCDEPAANVTLVFVRNGAVAGHAVTDRGGHYRLRLRAGSYTVRRATVVGVDRRLEPNRIRIQRYATQIDFSIDTGIR